MSVRLGEIVEHDAPHLHITNHRRLLAFYDALVDALKKGQLKPGGGALLTTLNALLALLAGLPSTKAGNAYLVKHPFQPSGVVALPSGDDKRQRSKFAVGTYMNFAGPPTP